MGKRKQSTGERFPKSPTCEERVDKHLKGRISDLRAFWKAYEKGEDEVPDLGTLSEYGLSFDFVVPNGRTGSEISYFRYQLSWGGPGDEFRFFAKYSGRAWKAYRVEYWFMDWFDGAKRVLRGTRLDLLRNIFSWFDDGSITDRVYRDATEDWE